MLVKANAHDTVGHFKGHAPALHVPSPQVISAQAMQGQHFIDLLVIQLSIARPQSPEQTISVSPLRRLFAAQPPGAVAVVQ